MKDKPFLYIIFPAEGLSCASFIQRPAVVGVVDHLPCHAAVDADVLARDEAGLVRGQEERHVGDVQGMADASGGLLGGVRALVDGVGRVDPAGGNGVDPDPACQADGQGVGQSGNAAFCGGVALTLGLAHPVPGGGNVDDAGPGGKVRGKELA